MGTIRPVDTNDPGTPETDPTDDPWDDVAARWAKIADGIREHYREVSGGEGPSEGEVKDALRTLGDAGRRMVDSVGDALRDPQVREQVRSAAAAFVNALGDTFSDLGDELRRTREDDTGHGEGTETDEAPES
jgi:hypothetical protein